MEQYEFNNNDTNIQRANIPRYLSLITKKNKLKNVLGEQSYINE
jgi:hypothetical protein